MQHFNSAVRTFDDVLGNRIAVEGLCKRVRTGDHETGVILYGPPGVGKRTLARLYAKAVLCEAPAPAGVACNACSDCKSFDRSATFGYIELDARDGQAAERARQLVKIARIETDRRVITVANADAYAPEAFDVLLKTLEETPTATTFVFLACDLKGVRLAGQSRCKIYRLRPLDHVEAKQLARTLCDVHNVACDERTLDLLVATSQGLPGRLRQAVIQVAGLGELTLQSAQKALGLDWVDEMVSYWRAVLPMTIRAVCSPRLPVQTKQSGAHKLYCIIYACTV